MPLLVAGDTEDKPEVANRVEHSGAGLNLRTGRPDPAAIRDAVRQLLTNPAFTARATDLADEFARHDGPHEAAALIEKLIATGSPVPRND